MGSKWRPRITPAVEAELQSLGPYAVDRGGILLWSPAPGFAWPWGRDSVLLFQVDERNAGDADFRRLVDAWRQVRERQAEVVETLRQAILRGRVWAQANLPADALAEAHVDHVGDCCLVLGTLGAEQVSLTALVEVGWDEEHGIEVDLIEPDDRPTWSFL